MNKTDRDAQTEANSNLLRSLASSLSSLSAMDDVSKTLASSSVLECSSSRQSSRLFCTILQSQQTQKNYYDFTSYTRCKSNMKQPDEQMEW